MIKQNCTTKIETPRLTSKTKSVVASIKPILEDIEHRLITLEQRNAAKKDILNQLLKLVSIKNDPKLSSLSKVSLKFQKFSKTISKLRLRLLKTNEKGLIRE